MRAGSYQSALKLYSMVDTKSCSKLVRFQLFYHSGMCYFQLNQWDEAKEEFFDASLIFPNNLSNLLGLATVSYILGNFTESLFHYNNICRRMYDPSYEVLCGKTSCLMKLMFWSEAEKFATQAILMVDSNCGKEAAYYLRAIIRHQLHRDAEASSDLLMSESLNSIQNRHAMLSTISTIDSNSFQKKKFE